MNRMGADGIQQEPGTADGWPCRRELTPQVGQNDKRRGGSAIDGRTTRHAGYRISQRRRKRIEEIFGWLKTLGMLRKTRLRGVYKIGWVFTFASATYNLVLMRNPI
jgi:hypothetical protein